MRLKARMIQCPQKPVKPSTGVRGVKLTRQSIIRWPHRSPVSAVARPLLLGLRAVQPARCVTGEHIALHAEPAHIDALVKLLGIVAGEMRGDAKPLLGGVVRLLRAGRKTRRERHHAKQRSPSHGTLSWPGQTASSTTSGRQNGFCEIMFMMNKRHWPAPMPPSRKQTCPQAQIWLRDLPGSGDGGCGPRTRIRGRKIPGPLTRGAC
jgi:hypothetical protein